MGTAKKATLDDAWDIITELGRAQKETDRQLKETGRELKENGHELKEAQKETDRQLKETGRELKENGHELKEAQKETDRQLKETDRQLKETGRELKASHQRTEVSLEKLSESIDKANGNFNQKWGDFLEKFIHGDLLNIFKDRNISVNKVLPRVEVNSDDNKVIAEYDFVLINGEEVIIIEVKTTVSSSKLDVFLNKLRLFKKYFPEYKDKKIYGGVAYINADKGLLESARENGLFLIQAPGGESNVTKIINPKDFIPKTY